MCFRSPYASVIMQALPSKTGLHNMQPAKPYIAALEMVSGDLIKAKEIRFLAIYVSVL